MTGGFNAEDAKKLKLVLVGQKYKIIEINNKNKKVCFLGVCIKETDFFYAFKNEEKYCECFLKIDFLIGRYKIRPIDDFYYSIGEEVSSG